MKIASEIAKKQLNFISKDFNSDKVVEYISVKGEPVEIEPTEVKDIKCPSCGGNEGGAPFLYPDAPREERKRIFICMKCTKKEDCQKTIETNSVDTSWIPEHFNKSLKWSDAIGHQAFAQWLKEQKTFITLAGKTGVGKTHSAITLAKYIQIFSAKRGKWPLMHYLNFGEYYRQYIEKVATGGLYELNRKLIIADVLIIDDFGLEKQPTDAFNDIVYSIINQRLNEGKKTIFTTNLDSKKSLEVFGQRIHSRVFSGTLLEFNGPDRRQHGN